ncbi:glutathione S-transferase family protein, partial [Shewanella algae]|uniref:glutathione S-transferase family protein n=1 Tax=Shewanella algae TaxID=38313 RepID=UPI00313BE85D
KGENKSEEYTKKFPFQKVPLLEKDGFTLSQSAAILHYLAQSSNQLYPTDAKDQAKHLEWMFFCMSDIEAHAAQIGVLMQMVEEKDRPHAQWMVQRAERLIARALDYLETHLNEKAYLMGDEFYAAD